MQGLLYQWVIQGLKKVPSGRLGQVDFPARQVTFHSHLPDGQELRQVVCQLRLDQGKKNLRAACPKSKLEFKFFGALNSVHNVHVLKPD